MESFSPLIASRVGDEVDEVVCRLGAADGYGGHAPGTERCLTPATRDIVDYHLGEHGDFWVCSETLCREGSLEDAVYLLAGGRETEG